LLNSSKLAEKSLRRQFDVRRGVLKRYVILLFCRMKLHCRSLELSWTWLWLH